MIVLALQEVMWTPHHLLSQLPWHINLTSQAVTWTLLLAMWTPQLVWIPSRKQSLILRHIDGLNAHEFNIDGMFTVTFLFPKVDESIIETGSICICFCRSYPLSKQHLFVIWSSAFITVFRHPQKQKKPARVSFFICQKQSSPLLFCGLMLSVSITTTFKQ